jgi:ribonuclease-3
VALTPQRIETLEGLLHQLGLPAPLNVALYHQAFMHISYTHEQGLDPLRSYERLEFLGDGVLKLLVNEWVFEQFPHYREGQLSVLQATLVSDKELALLAKALGFGPRILLGTGEANQDGANRPSILACVFEALLGALYLDGHWAATQVWVRQVMRPRLLTLNADTLKANYKAALLEWCQAQNPQQTLSYEVLEESGPAHAKHFVVGAVVNGLCLGRGGGVSKKLAQQAAAQQAYEALNPAAA